MYLHTRPDRVTSNDLLGFLSIVEPVRSAEAQARACEALAADFIGVRRLDV
jgi:hypothetical protein